MSYSAYSPISKSQFHVKILRYSYFGSGKKKQGWCQKKKTYEFNSNLKLWMKKGFRGSGLLLFYVGRQRRCIVTANINVAHKTELDWKDVEVCTFMSFIHYAILCSSWVVHFCKSMNCNGTSQARATTSRIHSLIGLYFKTHKKT